MNLPGTRLLAIARLVLEAETVARVLEPLVADWQREWLLNRTVGGRALVGVRGALAFLSSATHLCATAHTPPEISWRAARTVAAFSAVGLLILLVPFGLLPPRAMTYLLPSSLTLSLPLAMLPLGLLLGTSARRTAARRHLARVAIAATICIVAGVAWITPHANQAFREHMMWGLAVSEGRTADYRPPQRGVRELTLPELARQSVAASPVVASPSKTREELFLRITLPFMPMLLAVLGWTVARASKMPGSARPTVWWIVGGITFGVALSVGMPLERAWGIPRELAAWLPVVLSCSAIAVLRQRVAANEAAA